MAQNFQLAYQVLLFSAITISVIAVGGTIVTSIAFYHSDPAGLNALMRIMQRGSVVKIMSATLIVLVAGILGIVKIIPDAGVVAILSGIAGYVLGGLERGSRPQDSPSLTED